jgi:PKD repeat protein
VTVTYTDIWHGHDGEGNLNEDPRFIDAAAGNFHLQYVSPCVDTGTADGAPADDLDNNPRPVGSGFDMGAYEVQTSIEIVSLTADPDHGAPPLSIKFVCDAHDSVATITGYGWDFGDGDTDSTTVNTVDHTYDQPGKYTAVCTVYNDAGEQSSRKVTVDLNNEPPVADAGADQVVPGTSATLDGRGSTDSNDRIVSWKWELEHTSNPANNRTAEGEIVTLDNLAFGYYLVTLTVTDSFGDTSTDEMCLAVAASSNCSTCPIWEDSNGVKHLDGPLVIENKGLLIIE